MRSDDSVSTFEVVCRIKRMGRLGRHLLFCLTTTPLLAACATIEAARDIDKVCALYEDDNDVIRGGKGDDRIDGGRGIDIAVYRGKRASYVIVLNEDLVSINGPDGNDTVTTVELLAFDDVVLNLYAAMSRAGAPTMGVLDRIPVWPFPKTTPDRTEYRLIDQRAILAPCLRLHPRY